MEKIVTLSSRLGFVDFGARGGTNPKAANFHDRLHRVLVEPDPVEAERLREKSDSGKIYTVIGTALGHIDGEIDLYVTRNPTCTSALPVNYDFLDQYSISYHFELSKKIRVKCSRYDTLFEGGSLPIPHAIKVDVQGFEYQVLQGLGRHLNNCLAIELETHFYQIYKDQQTIGDIVRFLSSFDFVLRSIRNSRSPLLRGDRHFGGDLIEVDAFFTKSQRWLLSKGQETQDDFKLACAVLDIDAYPGP